MHLADFYARRIENVPQILWATSVPTGAVTSLNEKAFVTVGNGQAVC